ncbi:hypothetical protein PVK06_030950 [Gossypium arboreum]|uniref:DUF4283 domain-containing protein n=1 Tax=Gossypium arboreum TaxID=29729 RepID=A0ABR0NPM9_GOSAR|nr:hypothetical protein PVK06_030950 [Gossypium arboreum]
MLSNSQFSSNDGDGDPHPESDRNTKKVRFKDNLVEEDTIMDRDPNPKLTLLWKDKLLGGLTVDSALDCSAPTEGSNNHLRLLEGDVNTTIIDGVPAITFSNRIKDILFKEIELMVAEDYNRVSSQGPWIVYGQYLTIQLLTKHFSPSQYYPGIVMAWIRFLNLPGYLYKRKIIGVIGVSSGRLLLMDPSNVSSTRPFRPFVSPVGFNDFQKQGEGSRVWAIDVGGKEIFTAGEEGFLGEGESENRKLTAKLRGFKPRVSKYVVRGSFDKAGYGANEGLGSPSGSIMKEGLGSERLERMSRMPKYALDKSLGKRPMGLDGLLQNNRDSLDKLPVSHFSYSVSVGSKHACTQNDSHFDFAKAQGSILNDPKDKRSGGSQSNRKTSFALQGRGNRFKPSRNTRIPQILCRNSNAKLNGVGSHLEGNNGLES